MSFLDLSQEGPMVVKVTAGLYGAFFDLWQQPIGGFGPLGVDKGEGGKFLIVPVGYQGAVPQGHFRVESRTTLAVLLARAFVQTMMSPRRLGV